MAAITAKNRVGTVNIMGEQNLDFKKRKKNDIITSGSLKIHSFSARLRRHGAPGLNALSSSAIE